MTDTKPKEKPKALQLPSNVRAEESLVGAMLLSRDAIEDALGVVDVSHFANSATRDVFDSILAVYESGSNVDAVTVSEELSREAGSDRRSSRFDGLAGHHPRDVECSQLRRDHRSESADAADGVGRSRDRVDRHVWWRRRR